MMRGAAISSRPPVPISGQPFALTYLRGSGWLRPILTGIMIQRGIKIENGHITLPAGPGLGIIPDEIALARLLRVIHEASDSIEVKV